MSKHLSPEPNQGSTVDDLYERVDKVVTETFNREFHRKEKIVFDSIREFSITMGRTYGEVVGLEIIQFAGELYKKLHPPRVPS